MGQAILGPGLAGPTKSPKEYQFLPAIDEVTPAGKTLHLIAANYATHKDVKVQR
jgi:hypothetical protein